MGGQTALNVAMALARERRAREVRRRADRRQRARDRDRRRPRAVRRGDAAHRARGRRRAASPRRCDEALGDRRASPAIPAIIRPSFTLGGTGGGIAYNREEFEEIVRRGLDLSPMQPGAHRAQRARLEGVRARGDARPRGQRRDRLLDREPRSDGRAHRRLDHRRAGDDADRSRVPGDARRGGRRSSARSASRRAAATSSSPSIRATARCS